MTERSLMWGGTATGDAALAAPHGAPYSDDAFSDMIRDMLLRDRTQQGVLPVSITGFTGDLIVTTNDSQATVATGVALVDGKLYRNDAAVNLTYSGDGSWSVVLRKSWAAQTVRAQLIATASITQTDGVTWDLELARIVRAGGVAGAVLDRRLFVRPKKGMAPFHIVNDADTVANASKVTLGEASADTAHLYIDLPFDYAGGLNVKCWIFATNLTDKTFVLSRTLTAFDMTDLTQPYTSTVVMSATEATFNYDYVSGGDGDDNIIQLFDELTHVGAARNFIPGHQVVMSISRNGAAAGDDLVGDLVLYGFYITYDK